MPNTNHINKILSLGDVKSLTTLSTSSIYRMMKSGDFPKQVKLSVQSVGWLASEVHIWIDARIAECDNLPTAA